MFSGRKDDAIPTADLSDDDLLTADVKFGDETVKVVQEELLVSKRAVAGETTRVRTVVETAEAPYSVDLRREDYYVERVSIDEVVDVVPEIRREGDVTIIPVLEERIRVVKDIVLREEIHLVPRHDVETHKGSATLRRHKVVVERDPAG